MKYYRNSSNKSKIYFIKRYLSGVFTAASLSFYVICFFTGFILLKNTLIAEEVSIQTYENLNIPNWSGDDYSPVISPDGRFLVYQSDRSGYKDGSNLWFSINKNYRNLAGDADWTPGLPLRFPFISDASKTMKVVRPAGTLDDPDGSFSVNTDGFEGMPGIVFRNYEPVEIFFTSNKSILTGRNGYAGLNIYLSSFRNGQWMAPEHLNIINSDFDDRMPSITQDGMHLYFSSNRPGGYGGSDIWYSVRNLETGRWEVPVNAGEHINSSYNEVSPSITETGILFFSSDRPSGYGHYDLYFAHQGEKAKNAGLPFNSDRDDEYFSITGDGLWAYFSSDRDHPSALGGMDLYRAVIPDHLRSRVAVEFTGLILDGTTRKPLGVDATIKINYEKETIVETSSVFQRDPGKEIVNNFRVTLASGREYVVSVSAPGFHPVELILDYRGNIPSGKTDRRVIVLQPVRKAGDTMRDLRLMQGRVIDRDTGLSLPGSNVEYSTGDGGMISVDVDTDGRFAIRVIRNKEFKIQARAPGYENAFKVFLEKEDLREVVIELGKKGGSAICPGDAPQCIDNLRVYFDSDSSKITDREKKTLDAIIQILIKNPEIKVEIQGHTDRTYRGPKKEAFTYNQRLSEMRAKNIYDYLIQKGIKKSNLSIRGYSFTQPYVKGQSPKEKALNRRVEFRRIK